MQESDYKKNGIQEMNENSARKVNKKVTNKMSKNQKAAASSSTSTSTPDNYTESPQNARLDTSESEEESVSEVMEVSTNGFDTILPNNFAIARTQK